MVEPGARTYLLSPARLDGRRAQLVFRDGASFELAMAVRGPSGAPIGEVFRFLSGLYFRGKLAYAERFAASGEHVLVITSNRGLVPASTRVTLDDLARLAETDIHPEQPAFRDALARDAAQLGARTGSEVVLLGSIATAKYVEVLLEALGERLVFPLDFVGRGDMSRGGLLLRAADAGEELSYGRVRGAIVRGRRPPKLVPRGR